MRQPTMRAFFTLAAAAAGWVLAAGAAPLAAEDPVAPPQTAVTYVEVPDAGPYVDGGRELTAGSLGAIDINSQVRVDIDSKKLAQQLLLLTPEAQADVETQLLVQRLSALEEAVAQLQALAELYHEEAGLYVRVSAQRARGRENPALLDELDKLTGRRAAIALGILEPLQNSLVARLRETMDQDAAEVRSDEAMDVLFDDVSPDLPYNMAALSSLLNGEIERAEAAVKTRLAAFADTALAVELRGHLVRADGSAVAIPLPGHNTVQAGIERRFQKIDFALSDGEAQLRQQYEQLADQIREARDSGEDILSAVRQAFADQQLPIFEALDAAGDAAAAAGDQLGELLGWADAGRLGEWAAGPARDALSGGLEPAFAEFQRILDDVERDVETLETLGRLAGAVRQAQPAAAVVQLLGALSNTELANSVTRALTPLVWAERLARVQDLIAGVGDVPLAPLADIDGPIMAWNDAVGAVEEVKTALEPIQEGARQALAAIRGAAVAPVVVDLPEPEGQKRRDVHTDLDTEFNLRTLPANRVRGDEIRLGYTFYAGDEELAGGWTDTFRIEVFGWQGRAFASVALVRFKTATDDSDRWEPTAPISYMLHRRPWPKEGQSGLPKGRGGPAFTFGFSTMPLDFTDEESIELGLAANVGLFDNFVMLGYGVNLQADEEDFFFLSLRPFSLGSLFSPAKSE